MKKDFSSRVKRLPPYLFAEIEKTIIEKKKQGVDVISLSIGDPDLPPPQFILNTLKEEAGNPRNHNYSFSQGEPDFRQAVADWFEKRFKVDLNPENEVIALIGSKEGLANVTRAFINPGDSVLVPDPAYPVYLSGSTLLSDGTFVAMPLLEKNGFKPNFDKITVGNAKMLFLNYPNNPTGATVDISFLKKTVEFAEENDLIICYDNAYSEITFDEYTAPSILEVEGAINVALEFHSFSKTFNMTGDRIGFAVGNKHLIKGLTAIKTQIDSGPPVYIQKVAIKALESYSGKKRPADILETIKVYEERRDLLVNCLNLKGFKCQKPKATFYIWLNCKCDSMDFSSKLIDVGVLATPGIGFGKHGEGYMRFALTQSKERIKEACERLDQIL